MRVSSQTRSTFGSGSRSGWRSGKRGVGVLRLASRSRIRICGNRHGRVVRAASEFEAATQAHRIEWHWVKGHSGNVGNERADALANRGIDELVSGGAARLR